MKLTEITNQQQFNNWVFPSQPVLQSDFNEYKKKEDTKWKGRAQRMGFRFPIFDNFNHFKHSLQNSQIIPVTKQLVGQVEHLTSVRSLDELRNMVSGYVRPRDVQSIVQGFENNDPIPYPIILNGTNGMHIMAGNTRINAARVLGITPKALIVDVSNKEKQ